MNCCICKKEIQPERNELSEIMWDQGNNAEPIMEGRCCNSCNSNVVIPIRMLRIFRKAHNDHTAA